jgi:hypothetical protein
VPYPPPCVESKRSSWVCSPSPSRHLPDVAIVVRLQTPGGSPPVNGTTKRTRRDDRAECGNCGCSVRTLGCQRATSCEELLRCCAPLSDEYRAEPNQDGTCQDTQYSPGRGNVSRKRRNCNHHGQNKLDGCGDVILPPRGWRFGIPTVHCRRVGHPFLPATAAMLPGIDMIERTTSGRCG